MLYSRWLYFLLLKGSFWLTLFLLLNGSLQLIKTEGLSDFGGWKVQDGGCCNLYKWRVYNVKTLPIIQDDNECLWYLILYGLGGNVSRFSLEMLIPITWFLSYSFSNFLRAKGIQDESESMQNFAQIFLSNKPVYDIIRKLSSSVSQIPRRVGLCLDLKY